MKGLDVQEKPSFYAEGKLQSGNAFQKSKGRIKKPRGKKHGKSLKADIKNSLMKIVRKAGKRMMKISQQSAFSIPAVKVLHF